MTLRDITSEAFIEERIKYIFSSFQRYFPNIRYDERPSIVGIGEPGRYLLCYFKKTNENLLSVKFKANESAVSIALDASEMDLYIKETVEMFQNNDFSKKKEKVVSEEKGQSVLKVLYYKATKTKVRNGEKKPEVNRYLESIHFDENHFDKGTVGRVLCLRKKVPEDTTVLFCGSVEELRKVYLSNEDNYEDLFEKTKIFLSRLIEQIIQDERNKDIVLSLLGMNGTKYTMEALGVAYGITRERVRQIFQKELTKLSRGFNLYSEDGIARYVLRSEYFAQFSDCPIDAFMLYLRGEKKEYILKAFYRAILHDIIDPESLSSRLSGAYSLLSEYKKKDRQKAKEKTVAYNDFQVIIDGNGEILTDLELLDQLKQARAKLANGLGGSPLWIYRNKQLVILATLKPIDRATYSSLSGFSDETWDEYGAVMISIIKNHMKHKDELGGEL